MKQSEDVQLPLFSNAEFSSSIPSRATSKQENDFIVIIRNEIQNFVKNGGDYSIRQLAIGRSRRDAPQRRTVSLSHHDLTRRAAATRPAACHAQEGEDDAPDRVSPQCHREGHCRHQCQSLLTAIHRERRRHRFRPRAPRHLRVHLHRLAEGTHTREPCAAHRRRQHARPDRRCEHPSLGVPPRPHTCPGLRTILRRPLARQASQGLARPAHHLGPHQQDPRREGRHRESRRLPAEDAACQAPREHALPPARHARHRRSTRVPRCRRRRHRRIPILRRGTKTRTGDREESQARASNHREQRLPQRAVRERTYSKSI